VPKLNLLVFLKFKLKLIERLLKNVNICDKNVLGFNHNGPAFFMAYWSGNISCHYLIFSKIPIS